MARGVRHACTPGLRRLGAMCQGPNRQADRKSSRAEENRLVRVQSRFDALQGARP